MVRKIAENYRLPYYTLSPTYSVCRNHGYLAGEAFTCPKCGEKAEVYSRITGYYRPVQNWNDGKTQEYKDRQVYDINSSMKKHPGNEHQCECGHDHAAAAPSVSEVKPDHLVLFTTRTCPNCRMARTFLDRAGITYDVVIADENPDKAEKFGIRQAPTLCIMAGDEVLDRVVNVSNIRRYIDENAAVVGK